MFGSDEDPGIIPRALYELFARIAADESGASFVVKVKSQPPWLRQNLPPQQALWRRLASMLEVHLEELRDLLRPGGGKLRYNVCLGCCSWGFHLLASLMNSGQTGFVEESILNAVAPCPRHPGFGNRFLRVYGLKACITSSCPPRKYALRHTPPSSRNQSCSTKADASGSCSRLSLLSPI
jgi:hypothetical protein